MASPGRAGYPISNKGLSAEDILRKAMGTRPPDSDPPSPKKPAAKPAEKKPKK